MSQEYLQYILPSQIGNSHPRFRGWIAGTGTVMGTFAEMLATAVPSIVSIKARTYLHAAITNHRSRRIDFDVLVREVIRIGNELAPGHD